MDEQKEVHLKKNWVATLSIAMDIIGIISLTIYFVSSMQFLDIFLFSLFSIALGFVLSIVGLIVGVVMKEGKGRAIAGISLSVILLVILFPFLLMQ